MKSARIPRVWLDGGVAPKEQASIELPKRTAHHLLTVLRADEGSQIELFNGDGKNYHAVLERQGKKVLATVQSVSLNKTESPLQSMLIQSISRGDRMDTSVQKCVELGVTQIQPVYTRHSIPALKGLRAERKQAHWQAIAISAAEQSGRSMVPSISTPQNLTQWLKDFWPLEANAQGWVLDPTSTQSLNANDIQSEQKQMFLIGPETGLEPDEIALAIDAGFSPIRFGARILRTETAGPAVLTALQTLAGDLLA